MERSSLKYAANMYMYVGMRGIYMPWSKLRSCGGECLRSMVGNDHVQSIFV